MDQPLSPSWFLKQVPGAIADALHITAPMFGQFLVFVVFASALLFITRGLFGRR